MPAQRQLLTTAVHSARVVREKEIQVRAHGAVFGHAKFPGGRFAADDALHPLCAPATPVLLRAHVPAQQEQRVHWGQPHVSARVSKKGRLNQARALPCGTRAGSKCAGRRPNQGGAEDDRVLTRSSAWSRKRGLRFLPGPAASSSRPRGTRFPNSTRLCSSCAPSGKHPGASSNRTGR